MSIKDRLTTTPTFPTVRVSMKSPKHFPPPTSWLIAGTLLFIVGNLLALDYFVFKNVHSQTLVLGETTTAAACPSACLAAISRIGGTSPATAKAYFVPLGTGTNSTDDWTDVVGAGAAVDTAQYPRIKKVTFEATISVLTGNQVVSVRLFNQTDKHPVWFSEMSMSTMGPTLLTSQAITLDKGNKLYQVQMKTQLKFPANLTQSRIHITTY